MLSDLYRDIQLFRFDPFTIEIYILVSEDIQVIINSTGKWRFINET
jgi:hypothetical protein